MTPKRFNQYYNFLLGKYQYNIPISDNELTAFRKGFSDQFNQYKNISRAEEY